MIDAIRASFKKGLPNLDWMDDKTRRAAEDKVMMIDLKLANVTLGMPISVLIHVTSISVQIGRHDSLYASITMDRPISLPVGHYYPGYTHRVEDIPQQFLCPPPSFSFDQCEKTLLFSCQNNVLKVGKRGMRLDKTF